MNNQEITPVLIERAIEQLRQERETFEQEKRQENNWFTLRLVMGYSSVVLLCSILVIASYVILSSNDFSGTVIAAAGGALFVDVLGLLIGVWKIALNPSFLTKLKPATRADLPELDSIISESYSHQQNK